MIVECSFCVLKFKADDIIHKEISDQYQRALKSMTNLLISNVQGKQIGQHCPSCDKLHVMGFREPLVDTIRRVKHG